MTIAQHGFRHGKRLGLMIRNERANPLYTTQFMAALFEEEGGDLYEVRMSVLGPSAAGRRPAAVRPHPGDALWRSRCINFLEEKLCGWADDPRCVGIRADGGQPGRNAVGRDPAYGTMYRYQRPKQQWWMNLRPIAAHAGAAWTSGVIAFESV